MSHRTPSQIRRWLTDNQHRFNQPAQYLGDEPNSYGKPWEEASIRVCLVASWAYEAAAGNQSIPAVYKAINIGRDDFLCDRFYLPATPRDLHLLKKSGTPIFGIESKHQLRDFDIIGTSMSYAVLAMSYIQMLKISDIPIRWSDREANASDYPMVMVGGLAYGAPEILSPVVDCWWLGEVEDEPGNPGIAAVTARVAGFKASGQWQSDRIACYRQLAREFNFLYFPRFIGTLYATEDRGLEHPSKQVVGYVSQIPGMRTPFTRRIVKDLDKSVPLDNPPLLYVDAAMGSGDIEVGRGCPAWSIPDDALVEIAGRGIVQFNTVQPGERIRSGKEYWPVAGVVIHGTKPTVRVQTREGHEVECTEEHEIQVIRNTAELKLQICKLGKRLALDTAPREWVSASNLRPGDYLQYFYGQVEWPFSNQRLEDVSTYKVGRPRKDGSQAVRPYSTLFPVELTSEVGWFLGVVAGDCSVRGNQLDIRIENRCEGISARLQQIVHDLFGLDLTSSPSKDGPTTIYRVNSARVVNWLRLNFGEAIYGSRLRVPRQVFESPRAVIAEFLSALYDANGTHLKPKSESSVTTLRFCSYSEPLIRQVAELFRLIGLPVALRVESRGVKRDGRPSDRPSIRWELRTTAPADGSYSWLVSRDPFKSRFLAEHFRVPLDTSRCRGQAGLVYLQVTGVVPGRTVRVMDVDVPGVQAFNVSGILVHNCSFCALSYRQKPYRQRSVASSVEYGAAMQRNMGATRLAPFAPDFPMYTQRKKLIAKLLETVTDEVDAPAMRVDDFIADEHFMLLQVHGGMDSVTLGVEGNSQRMRDLVGKGTADVDIEEAVTRGIRAGIRKFKLFMITNFPGEDEGDVHRILRLGRRLAEIRESLNQPTVRIQFSWTPLLIEATTPFQWFAATPSSRMLLDVWDELRDLKIEAKIGAKGEPNKAAFVQLAQRASREIGEVIVDTMDEIDQACWGGVPRTLQALLDTKMREKGFLNGLLDAFDERTKRDMFGWEFISTGVNVELLWTAHVQMREFLENTDSETYDDNFDEFYRGAEWIARCDSHCMGKTCGACDVSDFRLRSRYIQAGQDDEIPDVAAIKPVDQRSQAVRIRARLTKPAEHRVVMNDHWRFNLRRAAFRAQEKVTSQAAIAKRSIKFASDDARFRDWTHGVDYVEWAFTRHLERGQIDEFISVMNSELQPWMTLDTWDYHSTAAVSLRSAVDVNYYSLDIDDEISSVQARLDWWEASDDVPMNLYVVGGYFAPNTEKVNAKDFVDDMWLVRQGHRLCLRMLIRGRPSPYNIYVALTGTAWSEIAKNLALRLDAFIATDRQQQDFLRPSCQDCGLQIPINVMDQPFDLQHCPKCRDRANGVLLAPESAATRPERQQHEPAI